MAETAIYSPKHISLFLVCTRLNYNSQPALQLDVSMCVKGLWGKHYRILTVIAYKINAARVSDGHHHLTKDILWALFERGINVYWVKPQKISGLFAVATSITPTNYKPLKSMNFPWVNGIGQKRACLQNFRSVFCPRGDTFWMRRSKQQETARRSKHNSWKRLGRISHLRKRSSSGALVGCLELSHLFTCQSFIWMPAIQCWWPRDPMTSKTRDTCFVHLSFIYTC